MHNDMTAINLLLQPEMIDALKQSKTDCISEAYANGMIQAKELLEQDLSYAFLCRLSDSADNWAHESDEPTDAKYINIDNLPRELAGAVVAGFYDTILEIKAALEE
ncbi:MAG: hypothetical protein PHF56_20280 [Desulfuromonadaceae bacterium]|nr:hypothetical protein [Desulfuromonadaceae bacterium]